METIIDEDFVNGNWITEVQRLRKLKDPDYKTDLEICQELRTQEPETPEDKTKPDGNPA